jgi:hypothetical protein
MYSQGGEAASVLNSCRAGPCRVRARRAFVPYRAVSFIILFFFMSCRAVPKNDRRRHDTDKARRVWRADQILNWVDFHTSFHN